MRGFYRFIDDDGVVGEFENIITDTGKIMIAKFLAGLNNSYAGAIAVGVGSTAATSTDKTLEYEVARIPIGVRNVTGPESDIFQVSFKGTLPNTLECVIKESAIISQVFNQYSGVYGDRLLAKFNSAENWATLSSSNTSTQYVLQGYGNTALNSTDVVRIGGEGKRVWATSASSPSITLESSVVQGDFSGYSSADQFALALSSKYISTGTSIEIRLYSDATNYWFKTVSPSVHTDSVWRYENIKFVKSDFSQSGSPSWSNIVKTVVVVSTNNINTDLVLDGLSMFDTDYINPDYALVSRAIVTAVGADGLPAITKLAGKTMDVEYFLEFKL